MSRGRMIAGTVAEDKRFNEIPIDAALVYLMAIPQLDRDGLILGEPNVLWGKVCRRRPELISRMPEIIKSWIDTGLVTAYSNDDDDTILHFTGFQKNQTLTHYEREAESRFPCPPGYVRGPKGLVPDGVQPDKSKPKDEVRSQSGPTPDEVPPNVIESNGIEGKGIEEPPTNGFAPYPSLEQVGNGTAAAEFKAKVAEQQRRYIYADGYTSEMEGCFEMVVRIHKMQQALEVESKVNECRQAEKMQAVTAKLWHMGYSTGEKVKALGKRWYEESDFGKKGSTPKGDQLFQFASEIQAAPTAAAKSVTPGTSSLDAATMAVLEQINHDRFMAERGRSH